MESWTPLLGLKTPDSQRNLAKLHRILKKFFKTLVRILLYDYYGKELCECLG